MELGGSDGRVREEKVMACVSHDFQLSRRRAGQSGRAKPELFGGNTWRLVRLHVRPQREPVQHAIRGHAIEVVGQTIEIDERSRGFELLDQLWGRSGS